jgi:hypothetical protein
MSYHLYKDYMQLQHDGLGENKTFVVAYFNGHEGTLVQALVYAKTEFQALCAFLQTDYKDVNELHESVAGADSWISVLEIHNTLTE